MSKAYQKYNECVELLHSLHDVITLVCQLANVEDKTAMQILKDALTSMEEYDNATPEEKALIEEETNKLYEMLEQEQSAPKKKTKKTKKGLLN